MNQNHLTTIYQTNELLPLTVIQLATKGNLEAINLILKHYEPYINKLSLRFVYDEFGNSRPIIDEYTRRH